MNEKIKFENIQIFQDYQYSSFAIHLDIQL